MVRNDKDKSYVIILQVVLYVLFFMGGLIWHDRCSTNPIRESVIINDTTYNKIKLDSIEYTIIKRDSVIYTIKEKIKEDEEEIINLSDSATIRLFFKYTESSR